MSRRILTAFDVARFCRQGTFVIHTTREENMDELSQVPGVIVNSCKLFHPLSTFGFS